MVTMVTTWKANAGKHFGLSKVNLLPMAIVTGLRHIKLDF